MDFAFTSQGGVFGQEARPDSRPGLILEDYSQDGRHLHPCGPGSQQEETSSL